MLWAGIHKGRRNRVDHRVKELLGLYMLWSDWFIPQTTFMSHLLVDSPATTSRFFPSLGSYSCPSKLWVWLCHLLLDGPWWLFIVLRRASLDSGLWWPRAGPGEQLFWALQGVMSVHICCSLRKAMGNRERHGHSYVLAQSPGRGRGGSGVGSGLW